MNKKININFIKYIILLSLLSNCSNDNNIAIVEDNSGKFYYKYNEEKGAEKIPYPKSIIAEAGDSYDKISFMYKIPLKELLRVNKEQNDRNLNPGEIIYIPQILYHNVVHGQDMDMILAAYDVPKQELLELNQLSPDEKLHYGQILKIYSNEEPELKNDNNSPIIIEEEKTPINPIILNENENSNKIDQEQERNLALKENKNIVNIDSERKLELTKKKNLIWPAKGIVIQKFSLTKNAIEKSDGIIMEVNENINIESVSAGKIIYVGNIKKYGNMVIIKHDDNLLSAYGYLSKISVEKNNLVNQGDKIGISGHRSDDGKSVFYFALRKNSLSIDPLLELP